MSTSLVLFYVWIAVSCFLIVGGVIAMIIDKSAGDGMAVGGFVSLVVVSFVALAFDLVQTAS